MAVMQLMKKNLLEFTKYSPPTLLTSGKYTTNSGDVIEVLGNLQPTGHGLSTVKLPEGFKTQDSRIFYTKELLTPVSEYTKEDGDTTSIGEVGYVVFNSGDWEGYQLIPDHYAVILIKKGK